MHAVADYFPEVADKCGEALAWTRRGFHLVRLQAIAGERVEAVALEVPSYFMPEQARAAVDAGLHVYLAKPVARTCRALQILAAANRLPKSSAAFWLTTRCPRPANQEVLRRIHGEGLGKIAQIQTMVSPVAAPIRLGPPTGKPTARAGLGKRHALGCDYIATTIFMPLTRRSGWLASDRRRRRPSRICRPIRTATATISVRGLRVP